MSFLVSAKLWNRYGSPRARRRRRESRMSSFIPAIIETLEARRLLTIPVLNSNANATYTLYLDFDGHQQDDYNVRGCVDGHFEEQPTFVDIPAFGNGDQVFDMDEQRAIHDIHDRVAEDYAPFDINVTTVLPPGVDPKKVLQVVIGGTPDDLPVNARGVADFNNFVRPDLQNIVFVSDKAVGASMFRDTRDTAKVASHEAGHAFGLPHSVSDVTAFEPNSHALMAVFLPSGQPVIQPNRDIWFGGDHVLAADDGDDDPCNDQAQVRPFDEVGQLTSVLGLRRDIHNDVPWHPSRPFVTTAWWIPNVGGAALDFWSEQTGGVTTLKGEGVIETTSDKDFFVFQADGTFTMEVYLRNESIFVPNLSADLELWVQDSSAMNGWRQVSPTLNEDGRSPIVEYTTRQPALFAVGVKSEGGYGDLGRYTVYVKGSGVEEYVDPRPKLSDFRRAELNSNAFVMRNRRLDQDNFRRRDDRLDGVDSLRTQRFAVVQNTVRPGFDDQQSDRSSSTESSSFATQSISSKGTVSQSVDRVFSTFDMNLSRNLLSARSW